MFDHNIVGYTLNKYKVAIPVYDLVEWATWMSNIDNRRVDSTIISDARVSTVFLGLDHAFDETDPVLFETMVFVEGDASDLMERYHTYAEAKAGHAEIVAALQELEKSSIELSIKCLREFRILKNTSQGK